MCLQSYEYVNEAPNYLKFAYYSRNVVELHLY